MNPEIDKSLTKASLTALKWNYTGMAVRAIAQILIGIVLARLLGPKPFGQVAVAWLVIGFGNLVSDFGFGSAIIQRKEINESDIRYAFTIQMLLGVILTAGIAGSSGAVAFIFKQPDVSQVVQILALFFSIQAFGQTATGLLKRSLDFKVVQTIQVISYICAYLLLGVPLAYLGFGVWSLVAAQLTQSLLNALLVYLRVRHPIKPLFVTNAKGFFSFGFKVMGNNIASWSISNMDSAFIGRVFGTVELGLYSRAFGLISVPMNSIVSTLQGVLFTAYSRAQGNSASLKRTYLASIGIMSLICLPVFVGAAVVPDSIIGGLYGNQWLAASPLLVPLTLAMPLNALLAMGGPLIMGIGKVERELHVQLITAVIMIPTMFIASRYSLQMVAWSVLCIYFLRFVLVTWISLYMIGAFWFEVLRVLRGSIILSLCTAIVIWSADQALFALGYSDSYRLGLETIIGLSFTLLIALVLRKLIFSGPVSLFLWSIQNHLPQKLKFWVSRVTE